MPFYIAAGGLVLGSTYLQSNAAGDAADQQQQATANALAEQRRQFDLTRSDYAPYRAAGTDALGQLQGDINKAPTAAEIQAQPGYQFGLQQGQEALDRKFSAGGGRDSGAALKSAAEYATNYATTGYNAEYQRRQDRLNRLAAIAGIGQTATGSSAAAGTSSANAISGLLTNQGDASAAGRIAQGNIWGNALNQVGGAATNYFSNNRATTGGGTFSNGGSGTFSGGGYSSTDPNAAWTP